jgi:uncharacterized membrane protein YkvA (DUF1232 family)
MRTAEIRKQIKAALADERRTNRLRGILVQVANIRGSNPSAEVLDGALACIRDYIAHVPASMEAIAAAAPKIGGQAQLQDLLAAAERYWFDALDIIPDHIGLTGLLDDAYYVLSLLHGISEVYRQRTGNILLSPDFAAANAAMRMVIGEPHASLLDASIVAAQQGPSLQDLINRMVRGIGQPTTVPDPIWGNASIDEIVNARMGALGIV